MRVATEQSVVAMPECALGLVPDVGSSHFLPLVQSRRSRPGCDAIGMWLALTGARVEGHDLVELGLATHYAASENLGTFLLGLGYAHPEQAYDDPPDATTAHYTLHVRPTPHGTQARPAPHLRAPSDRSPPCPAPP